MIRCVGISFFLGSVSKDFTNNEQSEIFLNGTCMIFYSIKVHLKKKVHLVFNKYIMVKSNIK